MTTLPLRAAATPRPLFELRRIYSAIAAVFDVFAEAEKQAKIAHERYPFAGW